MEDTDWLLDEYLLIDLKEICSIVWRSVICLSRSNLPPDLCLHHCRSKMQIYQMDLKLNRSLMPYDAFFISCREEMVYFPFQCITELLTALSCFVFCVKNLKACKWSCSRQVQDTCRQSLTLSTNSSARSSRHRTEQSVSFLKVHTHKSIFII